MRKALALFTLVIVGGLGVTAISGCDSMFYRPNAKAYALLADFGVNAEDVWFSTPGGPKLHGWWLPAEGVSQGTVVYCHGNSDNLTHHAKFVSWLPSYGFNVLLFDYRGYGTSEGVPTRAGTIDDARAAIDFAIRRDPKRTLVFGHSLGGAIAIVATGEMQAVRAVVAESTFPSYRAIAKAKASWIAWLVPLFISQGYDPEDALAKLPPRPILVIHSRDDQIVPFELGESLYRQASDPRRFYASSGAGHFTPWTVEGETYEQMLVAFFRDTLSN